MKKTSEVTCILVDRGGLYVELARRLAREYKEVFYHVPNDSEAPKPHRSYIGYGFDEIKVLWDLYGHTIVRAGKKGPEIIDLEEQPYSKSDLVVFGDVGMGPLQLQIEADGKAVWGCRMAEDLELEREATKELFKDLGIAVGPYEEILGTDALREYLRRHEDVFIKISRWRGLRETFKSYSAALSDTIIDSLAADLGMLKNLIPFVVEKRLKDKVEIGQDMYTIYGKYPSILSGGVEIKDKGYIAKIQKYEDFPKPLRDVNEKMAPEFKKLGACCTIATEMKVGKDKIAYPIDNTIREPSPPGELLQELYTNLPEIRWRGANGEMVDPIPKAEYGVQINIVSDNGRQKEWQAMTFPEEHRDNIKLHNAMKLDGTYYIIPSEWELAEVGAVVGWGKSIKDAVKMVEEIAETIEGESLEIPVKGIVEEAEKELEKAAKMGLEMM